MDIEAIVKKYFDPYVYMVEGREAMRAALTELAAEYEQRIDALMVSHTEQMQELQRDKEYCCCGECTTLTPSTVAEREALQERIRQLEAERVPDGLSVQQEPKYTTNGCAIVNRASGEAIPPDEPVFVFRARDIHAREALEAYACVIKPGIHRDKVCERIADFAEFAMKNKARMKQPDTAQVLLAAEEGGE